MCSDADTQPKFDVIIFCLSLWESENSARLKTIAEWYKDRAKPSSRVIVLDYPKVIDQYGEILPYEKKEQVTVSSNFNICVFERKEDTKATGSKLKKEDESKEQAKPAGKTPFRPW
jgi:hypothetical protein